MSDFSHGELLAMVGELEAEIRQECALRERTEAQARAEAEQAAKEAAEAEANRRERVKVPNGATPEERSEAFAEFLRQKREEAKDDDNGLPWRYQRQASPWR